MLLRVDSEVCLTVDVIFPSLISSLLHRLLRFLSSQTQRTLPGKNVFLSCECEYPSLSEGMHSEQSHVLRFRKPQ